VKEYRRLLEETKNHLEKYAEKRWSSRLSEWIAELDSLSGPAISNHVKRTQRALGGMGSIGDVVISPEAGHKISTDEGEIEKANRRLIQLVQALDNEVSILLRMSTGNK
jgi:predicted DNA-binding protein YlxM (UPF0122 family)